MKVINCAVCNKEISWNVVRRNPRQKYCSKECYRQSLVGKIPRTNILIIVEGKKLCSTCNQWKLLSKFDKRPDRPIGFRSKCKACGYKRSLIYQNTVEHRLTTYKSGAKKRGYEWNLSDEQFILFWQKPCYYCGDEIKTIGLDRVDNDKGYKIDNVIPCCEICNIMRMNLKQDFFIQHCKKIAKKFIIPDAV